MAVTSVALTVPSVLGSEIDSSFVENRFRTLGLCTAALSAQIIENGRSERLYEQRRATELVRTHTIRAGSDQNRNSLKTFELANGIAATDAIYRCARARMRTR